MSVDASSTIPVHPTASDSRAGLSGPELKVPDLTSSSYESPSDNQLLPPPTFRPFFTLVEDAASGEHYHPTVHYFFSDDDPDGLTSSLLDAMHSQQDPNHRLLLVDVAQDGRTVTSAHSLNSSWQIASTSTVPAPSWTDSGPATASEGLMLKLEGQEAQTPFDSKAEDAVQRMESDIEAFRNRLAHLQNVLAEGNDLSA